MSESEHRLKKVKEQTLRMDTFESSILKKKTVTSEAPVGRELWCVQTRQSGWHGWCGEKKEQN